MPLDDGTPADPDSYDYQRAARDALHFAALFDRFVQNLRPYLGYDVQYFATVESKTAGPHVHLAMRGTVSPAMSAAAPRVATARAAGIWWRWSGAAGTGDPSQAAACGQSLAARHVVTSGAGR